MDYFGAVLKRDLTEETRTQLQEDEATASSCLILATPMVVVVTVIVRMKGRAVMVVVSFTEYHQSGIPLPGRRLASTNLLHHVHHALQVRQYTTAITTTQQLHHRQRHGVSSVRFRPKQERNQTVNDGVAHSMM